MTRSLFQLAFDHVEDCDECDLSGSVLCVKGFLLFKAAEEKCERLAVPPMESPIKA